MSDSYRDGISDADIIKQAEDIRREIESTQPLVDEEQPASSLIPLYEDNPGFLVKIMHLESILRGIRKNRGDGNCFYRSFLISIGEHMIAAGVKPAGTVAATDASAMQQKHDELVTYVRGSADRLLALGYPDVTIPDFHEAMMSYLESLSAPGASKESLLAQFTDKMTGLYIITYLRCLCSLEILENEDSYLPYILGLAPHCATAKHFCDLEVEAVSTDADHIQITALAQAWKVKVKIAYLDATPGDTANVVTFPEEADYPTLVSLLYRPGHYDIAYFKE